VQPSSSLLRRICFNSRPRAGGDLNAMTKGLSNDVSIHAPAQGATVGFVHGSMPEKVSIHAPAQGATPRARVRF